VRSGGLLPPDRTGLGLGVVGARAREQHQCQNDCTARKHGDAQVAARQAGASAPGSFCLAGARHALKASEPPADVAQ